MKKIFTIILMLVAMNACGQWQPDVRLSNASGFSIPGSRSVVTIGDVVHVFWSDERDGNYEVYYKRSTNTGISWGADTRLTNNTASSGFSSAAVSGSVIHILFKDERDGNDEIYYKRSTDNGVSWGADTRLTNSIGDGVDISVAVFGSVIHVVWYESRDGNYEIYYKRSTDGGVSWESDTRLSDITARSWRPSIAVSGSVVHVVWEDTRDGNNEIYYKRSTDGGVSWGADTRLTNNTAISIYPSVAINGTVVHVVWEDQRDGNPEIYYKRNPTGNPIGIQNISTEIPSDYSLSQNYPNPFNPATNIKFAIPKSTVVKIVVHDISGKELEVLVNEQLKPGTYQTEWNGSKYSSGIYFYKISASDFTESRKMILLK